MVHIFPAGSESVHKPVEGSLYPIKITLFLKITSHFSLSNSTLHPAFHRGRIPISNATINEETICPVSIVGMPGTLMSQMCVACTFLPAGKLIVSGFSAICLLSTYSPSILKMKVVPVLAMACVVAIVVALRYCGMGLPNNMPAVIASVGCACLANHQDAEIVDVTTVTSLSSCWVGGDLEVGSREVACRN